MLKSVANNSLCKRNFLTVRRDSLQLSPPTVQAFPMCVLWILMHLRAGVWWLLFVTTSISMNFQSHHWCLEKMPYKQVAWFEKQRKQEISILFFPFLASTYWCIIADTYDEIWFIHPFHFNILYTRHISPQ